MNACHRWNDLLLDYAWGACEPAAAARVEDHLAACAPCTATLADLRTREQQIDAALGQLVRGAEPSSHFRAHVLAAAQASAAPAAGQPAWKGALAAVAVVLLAAVFLPPLAERWAALTERRQTSVSLSEWRSPTESLLRAPAHELMQSAPRLGEFYFPLDSLFPETGSENGGTNNES
ncbi:MAG TPA: zf-HC2 domain-containing protein [Candidatus Acidoferrales bacterium]|nr:zf-HC2 domain-containing protein [Candidatus Acidoferrales bacterium]